MEEDQDKEAVPLGRQMKQNFKKRTRSIVDGQSLDEKPKKCQEGERNNNDSVSQSPCRRLRPF